MTFYNSPNHTPSLLGCIKLVCEIVLSNLLCFLRQCNILFTQTRKTSGSTDIRPDVEDKPMQLANIDYVDDLRTGNFKYLLDKGMHHVFVLLV